MIRCNWIIKTLESRLTPMDTHWSSEPEGNFMMILDPVFSSVSFSGLNLQMTLMESSLEGSAPAWAWELSFSSDITEQCRLTDYHYYWVLEDTRGSVCWLVRVTTTSNRGVWETQRSEMYNIISNWTDGTANTGQATTILHHWPLQPRPRTSLA